MWAVLLKAENPACAWCHQASVGFPGVRIRVQSVHQLPDGYSIEEVDMEGAGWREAVDTIGDLPTVREVEFLQDAADRGLVRLTITDCALPQVVAATGVHPMTPFQVEDGHDRWLLVTKRNRAAEFLQKLQDLGIGTRIVYSGPYDPELPLTPRQREILERAVEAGYYDYPRRMTLTGLAAELEIAKSTLSESLQLIERSVMGQLVQGGGVDLGHAIGYR